MDVTEAVARRRSVRSFRSDPVSQSVLRDVLAKAARAPSGGNLQPWHAYALAGEPLENLLNKVREKGPDKTPGYAVYPPDLWEPYRTRRFQNGEQLYASIGIDRSDKSARLAQLAKNVEFFGAPVGVFVFIDRRMGPPQWADLGMYLQTFMLLAVEKGLATCPQEYWALYSETVAELTGAPAEQMLFCGVAVGFAAEDHPINIFKSDRAKDSEWLTLSGF